ncbi:MAG: ribosome silencing factor [Proteobacteria bacterium]|nr:ribosome silencing factor [Pseudomonadota bacterium]MDE3208173.1 ribosome silencing factor [Pseudomonadota bacterium]
MDVHSKTELVVEALEAIKGRDIIALDVSGLTSMAETLVFACGDSNRQTRALSHSVQETIKASGGTVLGVEGEQTGEWVLIDLGDIIVHVMQPAIRQYYNIESLWGGTPYVGYGNRIAVTGS